jgi:hypothetical protein
MKSFKSFDAKSICSTLCISLLFQVIEKYILPCIDKFLNRATLSAQESVGLLVLERAEEYLESGVISERLNLSVSLSSILLKLSLKLLALELYSGMEANERNSSSANAASKSINSSGSKIEVVLDSMLDIERFYEKE